MTAQFNDHLLFRDENFVLAGYSGFGLFDPADHGLHPAMRSTACYRGYVCVYAVDFDAEENGKLVLRHLQINLQEGDAERIERGEVPPLEGIWPRRGEDFDHYANVNWPLDYSGDLLIGSGFIRELYTHMGFQAPYKYEKVIELKFDAGLLKGERDLSRAMANHRASLGGNAAEPQDLSEDELGRWIGRSFDRYYTDPFDK